MDYVLGGSRICISIVSFIIFSCIDLVDLLCVYLQCHLFFSHAFLRPFLFLSLSFSLHIYVYFFLHIYHSLLSCINHANKKGVVYTVTLLCIVQCPDLLRWKIAANRLRRGGIRAAREISQPWAGVVSIAYINIRMSPRKRPGKTILRARPVLERPFFSLHKINTQ